VDRQLSGELPPDGERRGLALSASKEIEPGARAMLLLADGLFRLDIVVSDDTIRTVVRNLSSGELAVEGSRDPGRARGIGFGDAVTYKPGSSNLDFTLGSGADGVGVAVQIGTLRFEERGTVQVTAQAIVRQASAG
jgi:hypothetical protein